MIKFNNTKVVRTSKDAISVRIGDNSGRVSFSENIFKTLGLDTHNVNFAFDEESNKVWLYAVAMDNPYGYSVSPKSRANTAKTFAVLLQQAFGLTADKFMLDMEETPTKHEETGLELFQVTVNPESIAVVAATSTEAVVETVEDTAEDTAEEAPQSESTFEETTVDETTTEEELGFSVN